MKKLFLLSMTLVIIRMNSTAQTTIEIIPSGGYTFADQVNFYNYYGRIESAPNWGGSLMFNVNRNFGIELMYQRIDASSGLYDYGNTYHPPFKTTDVGINYIMAGPVQSFNPAGSVHPFIGALLGAAVFNPGPDDYSSNTKFAWGAQLGANVYVSPRIGIRLKAQLLSPVETGNGGFYFGSFGSGVGNSTYSSIYQFGFSGGLIIGLGNILPAPKHRVIIHRRPPPRRYYYSPYPPY
ncbi:MAG: outer membrane beta-barrel protein [Bacteroidetes bacterium]|nr:outer membrane beta-barrel protein [Bacteroidota bacterium]